MPAPTSPSPSMSLLGHVALVTGGNHGIGAGVARALAARGADVVISYLRLPVDHDPEQSTAYLSARAADARDVIAAVEACGRRAVAVEADLSDPTAAAMLFDVAEAELGPVSVLVHNASAWRKDTFSSSLVDHIGRANMSLTAETASPQLFVDARAGALLMVEFITRHRNRRADWGRIVTLTSAGIEGFPGEASYGAAKAALVSYSMTAASEMAADGVAVNVVYPPVTDTGWITDEVRQFVATDSQHHHVAEPDEVGEFIGYLCSDASRLLTGVTVTRSS
jgi:3-oxoacyl-[acyl-carrier protein] reductase